MNESIFLRCADPEDARKALQDIARQILEAVREGGQEPTSPGAPVDPRLMLELSVRQLKRHDQAAGLLVEALRLFFKLGGRAELENALGLAHKLSELTYHLDQAYPVYLFKGIAQVGLRQTDLGIKNILGGLNQPEGITSLDETLGWWALMSAALQTRRLDLAGRYGLKWLGQAEKEGWPEEMVRARLALTLLHLVTGRDQFLPAPSQEPPTQRTPDTWRPAADYLSAWGAPSDRDAPLTDPLEPFPLFIGLEWNVRFLEDQAFDPDDFGALCRLRQMLFRPENLDEALGRDPAFFERYMNALAHWDLTAPLNQAEQVLKKRNPESWLQFTLTRKLGRYALKKVLADADEGAEIETPAEAVVLFTDIRGFSSLSEGYSADQVFDFLNPVFKIMNEELTRAGGTIVEFPGDCLIFVFNTFQGQASEIREVLAGAVECVKKIFMHNVLSYQVGLPQTWVGVGIHKGPVALGYLGGLAHCHLTVIGNTVNAASRIEGATKTLPGEVLVSKDCFGDQQPVSWARPQDIPYTIRDLGPHILRNISRPVHLFGLSPLLKYLVDFVPMGFVATPVPGVMYIDTGNSGEPGVIDHHFSDHKANSACELLVQKPELLLGHINGVPRAQIEFRLHRGPDLDCAATLYAAYELMEPLPRLDLLAKLAEYVSQVDQGRIPFPEKLESSLYGVFLAHQKIVERTRGRLNDFEILALEIRVVDAAVHLMEQTKYSGDFGFIFQFEPDWFPEERALIRQDFSRYQEDRERRSKTYQARVIGVDRPVTGVMLDHPQSIFFKFWARNDSKAPGGQGFAFLAVNWSQPGKNRLVISVDPESGTHLNGLGQALEARESARRLEMKKQRPIHPIRYPSDNSDPWYFGQGHGYTIIDSPNAGTVLSAEEVMRIHQTWNGLPPFSEEAGA